MIKAVSIFSFMMILVLLGSATNAMGMGPSITPNFVCRQVQSDIPCDSAEHAKKCYARCVSKDPDNKLTTHSA
ncbi:hypothetical protein Pyn_08913 [Prunus yedoensis var. nudiflora]|uniref:Uncharacterized protein n=1 Tax=Prunus yedoensis var. nudiflora TaxID=2094558 RepID=A0A314ZI80_PRUYE|nr:hypothetical protein Pyn_08913 [Prunus yedoensis var. nudiflora]